MNHESPFIVRVALERTPYDIRIGTGILADGATQILAAVGSITHIVIVCDENVRNYAAGLQQGFAAKAAVRADLLTVAPGESSKSIEQCVRLWSELLDLGADRKSLVVAVGGGVIGDLAGYVAASFARGIRFCQVPTTLLAQVDSSVGGKTGINLPTAKNMVGAFWQPTFVLIDTDVLNTLPEREYVSGLAEVVKYGVIMDEELFAFLEANVDQLNQRDSATLRDVVARCCRLKADVVAADEREVSGRRAILNYGHTFAHALEAVLGYGHLLHGEAVSVGMICASRLAEKLGRIPAYITERQLRLLTDLKLPVELPAASPDQLWEAMGRDKKVEHGRLRFVLPDRLGNVQLVDGVEADHVLDVLASS